MTANPRVDKIRYLENLAGVPFTRLEIFDSNRQSLVHPVAHSRETPTAANAPDAYMVILKEIRRRYDHVFLRDFANEPYAPLP